MFLKKNKKIIFIFQKIRKSLIIAFECFFSLKMYDFFLKSKKIMFKFLEVDIGLFQLHLFKAWISFF
ncbi:hypothetical protein EUGRSUZ_H04463 [Eucalyptus grandis]|uniref:Uncharacterized protein n=2 Tax=Eucalyptus grandis TaxID=71139 RepID=A0ACC3JXQ9_EUCGR|nr:hypothetical protein EUGRSUZ_H04463 [Eucalyptus grandis]